MSCQVFCDFGADSQAHCRRNEGVAAGNVASVKAGALAFGRAYAPCGTADPAVHTGDEVSVGQALGRAGSIPNECAEETHIHLEVLQGEQYLDPAKLLN